MILNEFGEEIQAGPEGFTGLKRIDLVGPARDPEWDRQLAAISPPMDHMTHLRLFWVPGDPWQPCERWIIYQMFPQGSVPPYIDRSDLTGPDPRTWAGDWDNVLQRFVTKVPITIDRRQWQIYQETGLFGFPYWVVQGPDGGHLRRFTHVQRALSKMEGGWTEPPAPGDLPYAVPDQRTWRALALLDELAKYEGLIAFHLLSPEMIQDREQKKAEAMKARMWDVLYNQQISYWKNERSVVRKIKDLLPIGRGKTRHDLKAPDYEESAREKFIHS